jgi:hypothetical protein
VPQHVGDLQWVALLVETSATRRSSSCLRRSIPAPTPHPVLRRSASREYGVDLGKDVVCIQRHTRELSRKRGYAASLLTQSRAVPVRRDDLLDVQAGHSQQLGRARPDQRELRDARQARLAKDTGDDWAGIFLGVELAARVPEPIQHLFLVARNTLPYGHFFYPLYTLGSEQLYRVADAAALHRYRDLGGPKTKRGEDPTFKTRIVWLQQRGVIADEHTSQWEGFRELRNATSHADMQSLFTPGNAYTMLRAVAECVNALYAPPNTGRAR